MELRSKKCRLCGHESGLGNQSCTNCDSDDLFVVRVNITEIDDGFWAVTLSRAVLDNDEAHSFVSTVVGETKRWREYSAGHGFKPDSLIVESGIEMGLLEMFWEFPYDLGTECIELVYELSRKRPGVAEEAQIAVNYYDTVDVAGDD